jgi:hypothetical protein
MVYRARRPHCSVRTYSASLGDEHVEEFPPPWTVEALDGGFKIVDGNGQSLAYVYGHADQRDAQVARALTLDEARRIASNIATLPELLGKD